MHIKRIQYLCPVAIATTCGIIQWAFSNNHLFGSAYKNILIAMDRIRQWKIDPTKHFQSEVHNLMVLIERANETNDNTMPDKNILAMLYEEISKDPHSIKLPGAISTYGRSSHLAAFFCRSGTNEQNRENTLNGIKNSNTNLFSISGK